MMRKINILYVITKLELGGAQTQLLSLIKALDRNRYNVFLFTAENGFLIEEALSLRNLTLHRSRWLERSIHPFKDLLAVIEIAAFIKKNKIDIVHTHSSKAGIAGRWAAYFAKARGIIHTVHGWSFHDLQFSWIRDFYIWIERASAKFTDKIIVVSNHDRRKGLELRIGCEPQYHLVRYGIERARFGMKASSIRKELGIGDDALVVGTISCFKPQKALEDFVQLAYRIGQVLPQARFLVVGDGVLRKKIEKWIAGYGLESRFILTGWRSDIPGLLSSMDVFVLTSLWEGLPIAVLEAMVTQLPVVATDTGGIAEVVIENETGFLVPCHDLASMLKKVIALLRDAPLRTRVGSSAKMIIDEAFGTERMVMAHDDLYRDLIEKKGRPHAF